MILGRPGEHGDWSKCTNWELDARVPFIIRAPWIKPSIGAKVGISIYIDEFWIKLMNSVLKMMLVVFKMMMFVLNNRPWRLLSSSTSSQLWWTSPACPR